MSESARIKPAPIVAVTTETRVEHRVLWTAVWVIQRTPVDRWVYQGVLP